MGQIDALLGIGDLTDEQRMKTMADSLRRKKRAADVFSMSTIKPIAQAATNESQSVLTSAARGGRLRNAAVDRKAIEARDKQKQANWQATFDQNKLEGAADRQSRETIAAARLAAKGKVQKPLKRLTLKSINDASDAYYEQGKVASMWKPEYAHDVPFARDIGNLTAGAAPIFATDNAKLARDWFGAQKMFHDSVIRLEFFGSQFTEKEIKEWKSMAVTPRESAAQTERKLARQKDFLNRKLGNFAKSQYLNGTPSDILDSNFGEFYGDIYGQAGTIGDFVEPSQRLSNQLDDDDDGLDDLSEDEIMQLYQNEVGK